MRNYFLALLINRWDKLELETDIAFSIEVDGPDKQHGFCPVFNNYKDALEYAGGDDDLVLMVRGKGKQ